MPQMSPIYWLILMMHFIFMMMILIMSVYLFFEMLPLMHSTYMKINNSMNWMW